MTKRQALASQKADLKSFRRHQRAMTKRYLQRQADRLALETAHSNFSAMIIERLSDGSKIFRINLFTTPVLVEVVCFNRFTVTLRCIAADGKQPPRPWRWEPPVSMHGNVLARDMTERARTETQVKYTDSFFEGETYRRVITPVPLDTLPCYMCWGWKSARFDTLLKG